MVNSDVWIDDDPWLHSTDQFRDHVCAIVVDLEHYKQILVFINFVKTSILIKNHKKKRSGINMRKHINTYKT